MASDDLADLIRGAAEPRPLPDDLRLRLEQAAGEAIEEPDLRAAEAARPLPLDLRRRLERALRTRRRRLLATRWGLGAVAAALVAVVATPALLRIGGEVANPIAGGVYTSDPNAWAVSSPGPTEPTTTTAPNKQRPAPTADCPEGAAAPAVEGGNHFALAAYEPVPGSTSSSSASSFGAAQQSAEPSSESPSPSPSPTPSPSPSPTPSPSPSPTGTPTPASSLALTMSSDPTGGTPDTTVTVSYKVSNSGDFTVVSIVITDTRLGTIGQISSLAPGTSEVRKKTSTIGNGRFEGKAIGEELGRKISASANLQVGVVLGQQFAPTGPSGC